MTTVQLVSGKKKNGFALIVTVSLLVLLAVLALGLLTLSTVTLRAGTSQNAKFEARANARLALMLAIGDLQKNLGPDQAVTARASVVLAEPKQPNMLGVWNSWRWEPALDGAPDYSEKGKSFRQWLASSRDPSSQFETRLPESEPSGIRGDDWQWLINPETVGVLDRTPSALHSDPGVKTELVPVRTSGSQQNGRFGWAVMDQSMGASLALNRKHSPGESVGERIAHRLAPSRARPDLLADDLSGLDDARSPWTFANSIFLTGEAGEKELMGRWHDLSDHSLGVLCDVTRGGLKVDLSNVFESESAPAELLGSIEGLPRSDELYFPGNGAPRWSALKSNYRHYGDITNIDEKKPRYVLNEDKMKPFDSKEDYEAGADSPDKTRLLPVITKLQVIYSVVSHLVQAPERIREFNTTGFQNNGVKGVEKYAVPKLSYDTVVTLYNPYDVELELPHLRLRIWDPPVAFQFEADRDYIANSYRFQKGKARGSVWHGLAQLQEIREDNMNLRKFFNLMLVDRKEDGSPGDPIIMQPGELRVFSPYVEDEWTWGFESPRYYASRAFHDTDPRKRVNERDNRDLNGIGKFGMRCIPGWDTRAGFMTQYHWTYGPTYMVKWDAFKVKAVPYINKRTDDASDFIVDVMAGQNLDEVRTVGGSGRYDELEHQVDNNDILRRYEFNFGEAGVHPSPLEVAEALSEDKGQTRLEDYIIERDFLVGDIYQEVDERGPGGKTPFAIFSMTAKSTTDEQDVTKPWLFNNLVVDGELLNPDVAGPIHHSYDLQVDEIGSFTNFPGIEITPDRHRGFFGSSSTAARGVSHVPANRVPIGPASSIGELVHSNLVTGRTLPRVPHAFGNSRAHPMVNRGAVSTPGGQASFMHHLIDHSYMLNDALWDRYFFSSVVDQSAEYTGTARSQEQVLLDLLSGDKSTLNTRLVAAPTATDPDNIVKEALKSDETAAASLAGSLMVKGVFNVNSDSVDAWRSVLMGLRDEAILGWEGRVHDVTDRTGFPRLGMPLGGDPKAGNAAPPDIEGAVRWAGFRSLDDDDIQVLAERIVVGIRKRGVGDSAPSQSLGEFANRRIGDTGLHTLAGILQTAIDESGLNQFDANDSKPVSLGNIREDDRKGLSNAEALEGESGEGSPVSLTQGDLMAPLSSVVSVRGDTFKVRAYGDARDGDGRVTARAWCEATLQRVPGYVDPADAPETPYAGLSSEINQKFGRRFVLVSFRWLSKDEI